MVRRYAYDPQLRGCRHVVIAVVDRKREYNRIVEREARELQRRRDIGESVDPREHISGDVMEPGHLIRAANGHLVRRALERGVYPDPIRGLALPAAWPSSA